MSNSTKFLVIDGDSTRRFLIVRTIMRVFPQAMIVEAQDTPTALSALAEHAFDAAVVHTGETTEPVALVRTLRETAPKLPILTLSRHGDTADLLGAGATHCIGRDEWLLAGRAVKDLLAAPPAPRAETSSPAPDLPAAEALGPAPA